MPLEEERSHGVHPRTNSPATAAPRFASRRRRPRARPSGRAAAVPATTTGSSRRTSARTTPRNEQILHEDPDFKFCILSHVHEGASESRPHDHGPSWAIYSQVEGCTEMTDWRALEASEGDTPGAVEPARTYALDRGDAWILPRRRHPLSTARRRDEADSHRREKAGRAPARLLRSRLTLWWRSLRVHHSVGPRFD